MSDPATELFADAHYEVVARTSLRALWPAWWTWAILVYAVAFAVVVGAIYGSRSGSFGGATEAELGVLLFPVGALAWGLASVVGAWSAVLADSAAVGDLAAGGLLSLVALPLGALHGVVVFGIVSLTRLVAKRIR